MEGLYTIYRTHHIKEMMSPLYYIYIYIYYHYFRSGRRYGGYNRGWGGGSSWGNRGWGGGSSWGGGGSSWGGGGWSSGSRSSGSRSSGSRTTSGFGGTSRR